MRALDIGPMTLTGRVNNATIGSIMIDASVNHGFMSDTITRTTTYNIVDQLDNGTALGKILQQQHLAMRVNMNHRGFTMSFPFELPPLTNNRTITISNHSCTRLVCFVLFEMLLNLLGQYSHLNFLYFECTDKCVFISRVSLRLARL